MPAADATAPAAPQSNSAELKPGPAAAPGVPPLKPRPKLFVALLVVFAAWLGVLLWMYATTVYPQRPATVTPDQPGQANAPR